MFTRETVVTKIVSSGSGDWKSFDAFMDKGAELLEAGGKLLDEAFSSAKTTEAVSTTIRIRLTPQQVSDLRDGKPLTFKTDGTTILLEGVQ